MLSPPQSHGRAARAAKDGAVHREIVPVEVPQRTGDPTRRLDRRGIRPGTTVESLASIRPAFAKDGSITAGNASQISDGASAVVVMSEAAAARHGVEPLGRVVSYGMVAGPDSCLMTQPSRSASKALDRAGLASKRRSRLRVQRGFCGRRLGVGRRPRPPGRHRQPQRWRRGPGPPHRSVGQPTGPHPVARVAPPGRGCRRGRPLRWRRPGRRLGGPVRLEVRRRPAKGRVPLGGLRPDPPQGSFGGAR